MNIERGFFFTSGHKIYSIRCSAGISRFASITDNRYKVFSGGLQSGLIVQSLTLVSSLLNDLVQLGVWSDHAFPQKTKLTDLSRMSKNLNKNLTSGH